MRWLPASVRGENPVVDQNLDIGGERDHPRRGLSRYENKGMLGAPHLALLFIERK